MAKENKFRMWDKRLKEMAFTGFHLCGEVTALNGMEHWIIENKDRTPECNSTLERWGDFIEMQWTGKVDKDGVDVYDGDKIEFDRKEWGGDDNIHEVSWDDYDAKWCFGGGSNGSDMQFRKVIGHIYEEKI